MHSLDARAAGETEQRLYTLEAWRETPFFSDRERAALRKNGQAGLGSKSGNSWQQEEQKTRTYTGGYALSRS